MSGFVVGFFDQGTVGPVVGVGDPGERGHERVHGVDHHQPHPGGRDEVLLDLLGLPRAQQPVVDEDAGRLVPHRALHQGGGHGGVHPARQPADHVRVAHLLTDHRDRVVDDVGGRPVRGAAGDVVQEPLEHLLTGLGVQHLGVPLDTGEAGVDVLATDTIRSASEAVRLFRTARRRS